MEDKLYEWMVSKELTWEGLIRDIVHSEGMDPWNIDISGLVNKYLEAIRQLKKRDIVISGKFILAAAILLKMKSDYLFPEVDELIEEEAKDYGQTNFTLLPQIPQPKKRKVTLDELIDSLKKALVVKERRTIKYKARQIEMKPVIKPVDLGAKIKGLYDKIVGFFKKFRVSELKFSQLIPSKSKKDVIWTFIPLVHLANSGKIKLEQEEDFGEIYVKH